MIRVMVIDDSATDVYVFQKMLTKFGMQVSVCGNAEDGIQKVQAILPDVILMDVVLPGLSGFQATRVLKSNPLTKNIPVIIVSGKKQEYDITWGMRQGADDYMVKPVVEADLVATIQRIIHKQNTNLSTLAPVFVASS